ncbi:hypothetical protein MTR_1g040845 [Medicago truncatula]|uniref:Uncharacterized protein n=1 Tax=Medicago truncatula TaxID=3880 RepID=G7ZY82_MEDTR|nr:hypothetical protein MTR_1g040815 [Medicago truncatula]KEH41020.1 hypothetical protein MTR_1g040845 [Medicago truncatula]
MEIILKYLITIIFLTILVIKGSCYNCPLSSLQIQQRRSVIHGKLQRHVSILNTCRCAQSQILLSCNGFQPIDQTILKKQGNNCLLFNGHPLAYNNTERFFYASARSIRFAPISSVTTTSCFSKK